MKIEFIAGLRKNLVNIPGWRTKRKIIVIESDDWGSIRMPSKEVYGKFINKGYNIANSNYNRLDTLESNEDLEVLFNTLSSYKDSQGNPANFTANMIVGNPDFKRISESGFRDYYFEPVTKTLNEYQGREFVERLWKQGKDEGIFNPQFHGREHVNVKRWMNALQERTPEVLFSFENGTTFSGDGDYNFMEVLDYNTPDDLESMKKSLKEGMDLFEDIFGYRSRSFIPPCYTWDSNVEQILAQGGVKYIQGIVTQLVPQGSFGSYRKKYHFLGNSNKYGQYFLIRNAFFEPSLSDISDPVSTCLQRIDLAFRWNKPAIIGSHRINYMGKLNERNRTENMKKLHELLVRIIKNWPQVEFMTSDVLGDLISKESE